MIVVCEIHNLEYDFIISVAYFFFNDMGIEYGS